MLKREHRQRIRAYITSRRIVSNEELMIKCCDKADTIMDRKLSTNIGKYVSLLRRITDVKFKSIYYGRGRKRVYVKEGVSRDEVRGYLLGEL